MYESIFETWEIGQLRRWARYEGGQLKPQRPQPTFYCYASCCCTPYSINRKTQFTIHWLEEVLLAEPRRLERNLHETVCRQILSFYYIYICFKTDIDRRTTQYTPQVRPDLYSNMWPLDHVQSISLSLKQSS